MLSFQIPVVAGRKGILDRGRFAAGSLGSRVSCWYSVGQRVFPLFTARFCGSLTVSHAVPRRAPITTLDSPKRETLPFRVPQLARGDPLNRKSNPVALRIGACSPVKADRESAVIMAEMTGRQLLLLACEAPATVSTRGLRINSAATIPGVRVTEKRQTGAYALVQLDASIEVEEPAGMQRIRSESFTPPCVTSLHPFLEVWTIVSVSIVTEKRIRQRPMVS